MKKLLVTLVACVCAVSAFSQGSAITFNNGVPNAVVAPIFGPFADPLQATFGNVGAAANGAPAGFPAGTTVYTGAPLSGTSYFAELWGAAGANQPADSLQKLVTGAGTNATLTFRTANGQLGLVKTITSGVVAPGSAAGDVWTIQMRVWQNDTAGHPITSWDQLYANGNGAIVAGTESVLRGASNPFNVTLGVSPVNPLGLTSFNIHTVVPEPSIIALGVLGVGALVLFRRRK